MSMHDEPYYAERVLHAGARGYLMKREGGTKLVTAIERVLEGHVYVSESIAERILESFSRGHSEAASPVEKLTDRETRSLRADRPRAHQPRYRGVAAHQHQDRRGAPREH
jgi:DNA-binding NarL/FixJ family response regulator